MGCWGTVRRMKTADEYSLANLYCNFLEGEGELLYNIIQFQPRSFDLFEKPGEINSPIKETYGNDFFTVTVKHSLCVCVYVCILKICMCTRITIVI